MNLGLPHHSSFGGDAGRYGEVAGADKTVTRGGRGDSGGGGDEEQPRRDHAPRRRGGVRGGGGQAQREPQPD